MPKLLNIGPLHFSWGCDVQQDDQAFYGIAVSFTPFRWAFLGLGIDRREQHHRDERQRLLQTFGQLESLLWSCNHSNHKERQGWVETADVRAVLDRGDGPHRWDRPG